MGTWGTGLYQDDTTCEVRDGYVANLKAGLSDADASRKILKGYGGTLRNKQVACAVYFALAETQWSYGRVDSAIRKRALDLIRQGADLGGWQEDAPGSVNARRKVLDKLAERLRTRPKPRRAVKVQKPKPQTTWTDARLGTIFLLPLSKTTFAALVLTANIDTGLKKKDPVFRVLAWTGRRAPKLTELRGVGFAKIPEGSRPGSDMNDEIGFITPENLGSPLEGLTQTGIVLPKYPRYKSGGFFTGRERITQLIAAGISGRLPPPTEWDLKFGYASKKKAKGSSSV